MDDFEAGFEEVSQENDGAGENGKEETQETEEVFGDSEVLGSDSLDDVEEVEDTELEEAQEDSLEDEESPADEETWEETIDQEDAQDEDEEQAYQPAWRGNPVDFPPRIVYTTRQEKGAVPMNYTLMHKDIPVADLTLDEATGSIQRIDALLHREHLPVASPSVMAWQIGPHLMSGGRIAPSASRSGLREALETLGVASSKLLLTRCYGLSLSDHYWIKPADSDLTWHNVNFFENPFPRMWVMLSLALLRKKRGSTSAPRTTLRTASLKSAGRFWTTNVA